MPDRPVPPVLGGIGQTDRRIREVAAFTSILIQGDGDSAVAFAAALRADGTAPQDLCLGLLAPAARRLGTLWEDDRLSFADVTIGCCCLRKVMHGLARDTGPTWGAPAASTRTALLAPVPGEDHVLGCCMLADFFRRGGWHAVGHAFVTRQDLALAVRRDSYAVIGLSVGCERHLDGAARAIAAVRRASRNPRLGVLVGGPVFLDHPEWAADLGADATAPDGPSAVVAAERLVRSMNALMTC